MNWTRAIEINGQALSHIVAGLVALLAAFEGAVRLPRSVYQMVARDLFKTESAVRRLIVIAARGLVVKVQPHRPLPAGFVIAPPTKAPERMAFPLYDTRVSYSWDEVSPPITGPRIRVVDRPDPRSQFLALFKRPVETLVSAENTRRLRLRLSATEFALTNLMREAKRMARWTARRAQMANAKFTSPLRPGPPPGRNKQSRDDIDLILRECHALAFEAQRPDTS
jgi:hypothetical protein